MPPPNAATRRHQPQSASSQPAPHTARNPQTQLDNGKGEWMGMIGRERVNYEWSWQFGWLQALPHGRLAIFWIFSGRSPGPIWRARQLNRRTDRQAGRQGEDRQTDRQSQADECLLVFAYFALMTLFCLLRVERKRKNRKENQKRKTTNEMLRKICGSLRTMPMAADTKQIFFFIFFGEICSI